MRFDRFRQLPWIGPFVVVALLAPTASGASVTRVGRDEKSRYEQRTAPLPASDRPEQQPVGSATRSVEEREEDDGPGGGGPPFGVLCPVLIGVPWSTKLLGSPAYDFAFDVVTDDEICAIFEGGETLGSLAGSSGMADGYVVRYGTGGSLAWVRQLGSAAHDAVTSIDVDSQHNVYVTGWTNGTLPGSPTPNQGGSDVFLAKYDENGNRLWTRQLGSVGDESASSVAVDENDEILIAGGTDGVLPGAAANAGGSDYFIARYDGSGNVLMITERGTSGDDYAHAIAVGLAGNVYVAGETTGALSGPSNGLQDLFVGKYNSSLGQLWVRQRGTSQFDSLYGLAVNADGQVFASGGTAGSLDGNVNQGGLDVVVLRYDANGTWVWTDQRGTDLDDLAMDVALGSTGGPYTAGWTLGGLDGNVSAGDYDLFLMKHGKAGAWHWTRQMGTATQDNAVGIAMDGWDHAYVVGYTLGNLGGTINAGTWDAFAVKYDRTGVVR